MRISMSLEQIDQLIAEDTPYGDLTTQALGIDARPARVTFAARGAGVVCGTEEAGAIFQRLGAQAVVGATSGVPVAAGTLLLEARGDAGMLLAGWKVAQTLVEWSSGVATGVSQLRTAACRVAPGVAVACTRKTIPLTRRLAVKAVAAGGGIMHRTGLSDTVLLFPEHRLFDSTDLPGIIARLRAREPKHSVTVEVNDFDEALAAAGHADVVQLEKFAPGEVARVVAAVRARSGAATGSGPAVAGRTTLVAAAGGINPSNAAAYAAAGADILVSSWPYQAPPCDVEVRFCPV